MYGTQDASHIRQLDSENLTDDDGLKHIDSLLKSKYTAKGLGTPGFEELDVKKPPVVESCL